METRKPIGVFDSGVGGLSVLRELWRVLPGEDYLYVADTARVPYGDRPLPQIKQFAFEIMDWLVTQQVKTMVIACNVSTAVALTAAQETYHVPVYGLINHESVGDILAAAMSGRIGLLATTGTVQSGAYARALQLHHPGVVLTAVPCPKFVPLIESCACDGDAARAAVAEYLAPLQAARCEALILGCTHYPFLRPLIEPAAGMTVIDPGIPTVRHIRQQLALRNLLNRQAQGTTRFIVSGRHDCFRTFVREQLGSVAQPEPAPWLAD